MGYFITKALWVIFKMAVHLRRVFQGLATLNSNYARSFGVRSVLTLQSARSIPQLALYRRFSDKVEKPESKQTKTEENSEISEEEKEADPFAPYPNDINPATKERGGPKGPEPTRYGDWERKGRCIDF